MQIAGGIFTTLQLHNRMGYSDIWDGTNLREKIKEGSFYSHAENMALMLSTDGVPLSRHLLILACILGNSQLTT